MAGTLLRPETRFLRTGPHPPERRSPIGAGWIVDDEVVDVAAAVEHLLGLASNTELDPAGAAGEPLEELSVTDAPMAGLKGEGMEVRGHRDGMPQAASRDNISRSQGELDPTLDIQHDLSASQKPQIVHLPAEAAYAAPGVAAGRLEAVESGTCRMPPAEISTVIKAGNCSGALLEVRREPAPAAAHIDLAHQLGSV